MAKVKNAKKQTGSHVGGEEDSNLFNKIIEKKKPVKPD